MARLARGAATYLKQNDGNLCLQLRSSDHERAASALLVAIAQIGEIRSAYEREESALSFVSEPLRLPDGPALMIDMADEPPRVLRQAAEAIIAQADAAGLEDAEVGPPRNRSDHPFWGPTSAEVPGAMYPQLLLRVQSFRRSIPAGWIDPLVAWLLEGQSHDAEIWTAIVSLPFTIPARAVKGFLDPPASAMLNFMAGGACRRRLYMSGGVSCDVLVSFAGTGVPQAELDDTTAELQELARSLAPHLDYAALGYRQIGTDGDVGVSGGILGPASRGVSQSYPRHMLSGMFCWQILSPEHASLLPSTPDGSRWLEGDRLEVAFGDLHQWWEGTATESEHRAHATEVLRPLLRDSLPAMTFVVRGQHDWGTVNDIKAALELALPGGSWASRLAYEYRHLDHPIQAAIDHRLKSITFIPAGPAARRRALQIASSFPGEVHERSIQPLP